MGTFLTQILLTHLLCDQLSPVEKGVDKDARSASKSSFEIPSDVEQQEVWNLEERLRQIEGVTTELQEPKDLIAATLLFLHVAVPLMGQVAAISGGIKATHDAAKIIFDFLHPVDKEKGREYGKNKVVIIKKGKRIELYNLSTKEIEKVLEEQ